MKNVLSHTKKGILMVAIMATVMGYANEMSLMNYERDLRATALTIANAKEGNLLSIKDGYGITLYKEIIKQTGTYNKGFDLTDLPDGDYFFEIDKDMEINTFPFTVTSGEVTFNKEMETTVFKPFVREENDLVYVTKLAPNKEPLSVKIYGIYNGIPELLYKETIEGIQNIERAFKLYEGEYKLVFASSNKEFIRYINK
ncbi:hypothetical protein [Seonamhaeicola aphaedonensis]|uniref:Uncharacterized protein n=1 Tax=Seonamhaeicola aphaedonensis TaxID=1461338 RepID=A0A3D9HH79_9FLAO|nr:hypothetical protein [Seonamhaeicola aphaedonensis]RED48857.1 hypothetical protein DFQ02_103188 [Seonamhaeicola aphaedonensis]